MPHSLRNAVVVVTGASSGIGRATALAFAREGSALVLTARRETVLREVVNECDRSGAAAIAVPADVADEAAVRQVAARAIERFGRIDVWVNNAGVSLFARFDEASPEAFRRVLETNLFGYVHGARAALGHFRERGAGVLINVASMVGRMGAPYVSAYVTSKFGVVGLSQCLRQELVDQPDVHVATILPASTDTPLFQHAANYTGRAVQPLAPVHRAEDVARAIVACARHPRREVVVGTIGGPVSAMAALAPGLTERLTARQVERGHFQDSPAEPTAGNLFAPVDYGTGISGGWRDDHARRTRLAAAGLALAGVGMLAWSAVRAGAAIRTLPAT